MHHQNHNVPRLKAAAAPVPTHPPDKVPYFDTAPTSSTSTNGDESNRNADSRVIAASGVKPLTDEDGVEEEGDDEEEEEEGDSDSSSISSLSSSLSIPSEMSLEYRDDPAVRGGKAGNAGYQDAAADVHGHEGTGYGDDEDDDAYRGVDEVSSDDDDDMEHLEEQEILRTAEQNGTDDLDFDTNLDFEQGVEEFALATSTATTTAPSSSIGVGGSEWPGFDEVHTVNGGDGNDNGNHDSAAFSYHYTPMDLFGLDNDEHFVMPDARANALGPTAHSQSHNSQHANPSRSSGAQMQKQQKRSNRAPPKRRSSYNIYNDEPFGDFDSDDSDHSRSDADDIALPDFLQQDALDPDLRRMIENDENQADLNDDVDIVEVGGSTSAENRINDRVLSYSANDLYDLPANIYHIDSETDWDSSDLEEEFDLESDGGETTDEDYPPPPTITHPRFLLRRESSLSLSTSGDDEEKETRPGGDKDIEEADKEDEGDMDVDGGDNSVKPTGRRQSQQQQQQQQHPQSQPQSQSQQSDPSQKRRTSRVAPKPRCGPLRGTFVADPHKPVALVAPNGVSLVLIPPYTSSRHEWLDAATEKEKELNGFDLSSFDVKDQDDLASPMPQQQDGLSSCAMDYQDNAQPNPDTINENLLLKEDDGEAYDEDDDAEVSAHEAMLKIDDFFDFDSSSEEDRNDDGDDDADDENEKDDESAPNSSLGGKGKNSKNNQYQPSLESQQAFSNAQQLLNHFDRGVVTAFRRNHWRYQTLIRFQAPQEQLPATSSLPSRPAGVFRKTKIQQGKSRSLSRRSFSGRVVSSGSMARRTPGSRQVSGRV